MKKRPVLIVTALGLGFATLLGALYFFGEEREVVPPPSTVHIRYSFLLKNESREPLVDTTFSMFGPIPHTESQEFIEFAANTSMEAVQDEAGNLSLVARDLVIPPFGSKSITATVSVAVQQQPPRSRLPDRERYLANERHLDMAAQPVEELARRFADLEQQEIPHAIYRWLVDNIETSRYIAEAKGASYALTEKKGDCTEFMHTFIALARLNGIPARAVGGFVLETDAALVRSHEYHNWAEFYQDGRWIVADAQKQVFGKQHGKKYVAFRYLDGNPGDQGYSQRFLSFDPRLSVKMM